MLEIIVGQAIIYIVLFGLLGGLIGSLIGRKVGISTKSGVIIGIGIFVTIVFLFPKLGLFLLTGCWEGC